MNSSGAAQERVAALRATFGFAAPECVADPLVIALEAAVQAASSRMERPSDYIGAAQAWLPPNAGPVERAMATAFALCLGAQKIDEALPLASRADCPPLGFTITADGVVYLLVRGVSISHRGEVTIRPLASGETVNGIEHRDGRHIIEFKAHLSQVPHLSCEMLKALPFTAD